MKIIETRHWNSLDVRAMCIREVLYTKGSDEEYAAMLESMEDELFPTLEDIYRVADDINRHSEVQSVTNIMYMLANDVIKSCLTWVEVGIMERISKLEDELAWVREMERNKK